MSVVRETSGSQMHLLTPILEPLSHLWPEPSMLDRIAFRLGLDLRLASVLLVGKGVSVCLFVAALRGDCAESGNKLREDVSDVGGWI